MKALKITLITLCSIFAIIYLAFLFAIPAFVKLDDYTYELKSSSNTNQGLIIKAEKIRVSTTELWNSTTKTFDKTRISSYTVIDETNKDQYSVWKGALGVALLGGFGAVAGIGGKKKKEYLIAIEWKGGEKSLICLDDEAYKTFVRSMFSI